MNRESKVAEKQVAVSSNAKQARTELDDETSASDGASESDERAADAGDDRSVPKARPKKPSQQRAVKAPKKAAASSAVVEDLKAPY